LIWYIVDEPREIVSLCTSDEEESEDEIEQPVDRPTHGGKCPRVLFEVYGFGEDPSKTTAVKVERLDATEEEKTGKQISLEEKDGLIKKPKKSKKIVLEDTDTDSSDNDSPTEVSSSREYTEEKTVSSLNSFDENENSSVTDTQNAREKQLESNSSKEIEKHTQKRVSWSNTEEIITTSSTSVPKKSKKRPLGVGSNKSTKKKTKAGNQ